ncbi:MAG TPA: DPP IV N-terminal domain-containing protein, partial [Saprospiraceae bacterium]|nr:DPP IV N-terminal domain-containing protein [Saprospiraceae bacterium]
MINVLKGYTTLLLIIFVFSNYGKAQKSITLEDIWTTGALNARSVPGFNFMNDGKHYTRNERGNIEQYNLLTGQKVNTLFDGVSFKGKEGFTVMSSYKFNADESKILILSEAESIFRRSSKVTSHIFDIKTQKLVAVAKNKKIINPTFSPDGSKIAYTMDFNMYIYDLKSGKEVQITKDGQKNAILNGLCDWVYEEEFGFTQAYEWNSNSDQIAFIRFDERDVPLFSMD